MERAVYSPIASDSDDAPLLHRSSLSGDPPQDGYKAPIKNKKNWLASNWPAVLILFLAVINGGLLLRVQQSVARMRSPQIVEDMDHPSAYPNLAAAQETERRKKGPRSMFPRKNVRVSMSDPSRRFGDSSDVTISNKDSMLMLYHLADTKFRNCIAQFIVGKPSENEKPLKIIGDASQVEIWNVTTLDERDMSRISWNNKPSRQNLVATLNFTQALDENQKGEDAASGELIMSESFPCEPGSSHLLELSCPGRGCEIKYSQEFTFPVLAFEMVQVG